MKRGPNRRIAIVLIVLALAIAALGGYGYLNKNYVFWNGLLLHRDTEIIELNGKPMKDDPAVLAEFSSAHTLDARGCTDYAVLMEIAEDFPELEVLYTVVIDGVSYSQDAEGISLSTVTEENLQLMGYLPGLREIDGSACTDYAGLARLKTAYPQFSVTYPVPVGGVPVSSDAESLTVTDSQAQELLEKLAWLPALREIDGTACADYALLAGLQEAYPQCRIAYSVPLGETVVASDTESLTLTGADVPELVEKLAYLPELRQVSLVDPVCTGEALKTLTETYPAVDFTWQMDILGVTVSSEDTEVDLSGTQLTSLEELGAAMECFPNAQLLFLGECGLDNETLAAFREEKRPEYKVAWTVDVGFIKVRTDDTTFFPNKQGLTEDWSYNLRYCEDMICIDVGHKPILTVTWAAYMPHLRYLIIADTSVRDLSPLSGLKELVYLEAFQSPVKDYSPLLGCTALEDLNISNTHADKEPLLQMTWLKRLWWAGVGAPYDEFREALPDTELMFGPDPSMGYGWRKGYLYFEMRDALGMYYMDA